MKKKNELVSDKEKKIINTDKKKIGIKKIILIAILISILVIFLYSKLNSSNKVKNYLESNGYICNNQTCTKDENNNIYTFDYEKLTYYVDTDFYYVNIGNSSPELILKDDEYVCTYTTDEYELFTLVDENFIYNQMCEKYVEKVNFHIKEYEKIYIEAKIDVNR